MKTPAYYIKRFEEYLESLRYAHTTVKRMTTQCTEFFAYLEPLGISDVRDVTEEHIKKYMRHLTEQKTKNNAPYAAMTINHKLMSVKQFYRYLYRSEAVMRNPFADIAFARRTTENKREIFTREEITMFLDSISITAPHGLRDRALFELLYSSGLRRGEIVNLNSGDLDLKERTLVIRQGKGNKDRIVPISETAAYYLKKYIETERPRQARKIQTEEALFLGKIGRLSKAALGVLFSERKKQAGIIRAGLTLHSIRHTCATHLLENGADVRYVQELLGHEDIQTTTQYTRLILENLKRAYKSSHPRENDYYEEITPEYLAEVERLKQDILKRKEINRKRKDYDYYEKKE